MLPETTSGIGWRTLDSKRQGSSTERCVQQESLIGSNTCCHDYGSFLVSPPSLPRFPTALTARSHRHHQFCVERLLHFLAAVDGSDLYNNCLDERSHESLVAGYTGIVLV